MFIEQESNMKENKLEKMDNSYLILWAWVRSLYQMLTNEQKKVFAEKLVKELMEIKTYVDNVSEN